MLASVEDYKRLLSEVAALQRYAGPNKELELHT